MSDTEYKNRLAAAFAAWENDLLVGRAPLKEQLELARAQFIGFRVVFENTIQSSANEITREKELVSSGGVSGMALLSQLTGFLSAEERWSSKLYAYAPNLKLVSESRFRATPIKKFMKTLIDERAVEGKIFSITEDLKSTDEDYRVQRLVREREKNEDTLSAMRSKRAKAQEKIAPSLELFKPAAQAIHDDLDELIKELDAAIAELGKEQDAMSMDVIEAVVGRLLKKVL